LPIVRLVARRWDGDACLIPSAGTGARFEVRLPLVPDRTALHDLDVNRPRA
jgi:hypothetical protein